VVSQEGKRALNLPVQEIAVDFVYSRQQKIKNFSHLGVMSDIFLVEVIIATNLDAE